MRGIVPFNLTSRRCRKSLIEDRAKYLPPVLAAYQSFETPFIPQRFFMQYVTDEKGRRYIDLDSNDSSITVGYCNPRVMKNVRRNMHFDTIQYNKKKLEAATKLVSTLPKCDEDWVVHFVSSRMEALEVAIRMARSYTGCSDVLTLRNGRYQSVSSVKHSVKQVMNPNMYDGPLSKACANVTNEEMIDFYANDVKETIQYETSGYIAAFLFEQVQCEGGIHVLPDGYMKQVAKHVRKANGLIIADEDQSGFGRMGKGVFWSFEMYDQLSEFCPDIVITGKALTNGFPIGAVMAKRSIAESITHKHFVNTYSGKHTVCSAASAVLDIVHSHNHLKTVDNLGLKWSTGLRKLQNSYPHIITDLRGSGLMQAIQITNHKTAQRMVEELRKRFIIIALSGYNKDVLRIMPPMCISRKDIAKTLDALEDVCERV